MRLYKNVLESLNLSREMVACAMGDICSPIVGLESPSSWYGFPPALVPIWSDGSSPYYFGYWKHWFIDREPCFVQMYIDSGRMVTEVARTEEQLFSVIAMMAIGIDDGVSGALKRFFREIGYSGLAEMSTVSLESGDDPKGFSKLDAFKFRCPLESVAKVEEYTGDFPVFDFSISGEWWKKCCSFELTGQPLIWPVEIEKPKWLEIDSSKRDLFDEYIACGNLGQAWLTLNSSGWLIEDARDALTRLGELAKDSIFDQLVEAWISVASNDAGGY